MFESDCCQSPVKLGKIIGLVVQLVRIPACHAGGRGFESRPDRRVVEPFARTCEGFFRFAALNLDF